MTNPPVDRTVLILNLLGGHPDQKFSLTEISQRAGIARATAHSILHALADHGYLVRHPGVTYSLGPALIPLGNAARNLLSPLTFVHEEMKALSERFSIDVFATAVVDREVLVVEHVAAQRPFGLTVPLGHRSLTRPPIGTTHFAWEDEAQVARWLSEVEDEWTPAQVAGYRKLLDEVRSRGYLAGYANWHRPTTFEDGGSSAASPLTNPDVDYEIARRKGSSTTRFNHISAPVFGPDGKPVITIMLLGSSDEMRDIGLETLAGELLAATARATHATSGSPVRGVQETPGANPPRSRLR